MVAILDFRSERFDLQVARYFLPSFESNGLLVQETKLTTAFYFILFFCFSFSSGGHLVHRRRTKNHLSYLVESHLGNIPVKFEIGSVI